MRAMVSRQSPGLVIALLVYAGGLAAGAQAKTTPVVENAGVAAGIRPESFWYFLSHNAPLLLLSAAGALTGGLVTLLLLLFNGMLMGNMLASVREAGALSSGLLAILPHAPFEILAILLAGTVGFMPICVVLRLALDRAISLRTEARDALLLLAAAMFSIVLAAMAEAWLTPSAIEHLGAR